MPDPVVFEELDGSPDESIGDDGFEATRKLKCAWSNRLTLASQLSGDMVDIGGTIHYTPPASYPHPPWTSALVDRVGITPFLAPGAGMSLDVTPYVTKYDHAMLVVHYSTRGLSIVGNEGGDQPILVQEELEPTAEFLTLDAAAFRWGSGSGAKLTDREAPGKIFKGLDWIYNRLKMPVVPDATFELIDCVNSSAVSSTTLGYTFPAETLLYGPPSLSRSITASGFQAWNVKYRFSYRPTGWNKFWRKDTGQFENIYKAGGSIYKPFQPANFLQIVA